LALKTETIPSLEIAYVNLRPLLFGALGKLARQGFVVSPSDSMDLIHDFFIEAWEGITSRYDPEKGSFESYVYGAFVFFARPRIIKLLRMRGYPLDPLEPDESETSCYSSDDLEKVRRAIFQLPEHEREVLGRYLYSNERSERGLAKEFSVSRYQLREILTGALGRIVVLLNRPERMPERDWQVALALWRDKRSVPGAAAYLGLTETQVRRAQARNSMLLAEALKYFRPNRGDYERRPHMSGSYNSPSQARTVTACDLLKKAFRSPNDYEILQQVRQRSDEVLKALEDEEALGISDEEVESLDPLWVAEIYEAIAANFEPPPEDAETIQALLDANAQEEYSIGLAYHQALMQDLPDELQRLEKRFTQLPKVGREEREELLATPAARAAMPYSEGPAAYGVTPLTVFYATEAVSSVLERLKRYGMLDDKPLTIGRDRVIPYGKSGKTINARSLSKEIASMAYCREDVANAVFPWLIEVAHYKPFLFSGFKAYAVEKDIRLYATEKRYDNLFQRWGIPAQEKHPKPPTPEPFDINVLTPGFYNNQGTTPQPAAYAAPQPARYLEQGAETWSPATRVIAGLTGSALIACALERRDIVSVGVGALGLALLARGITNTGITRLVSSGDEPPVVEIYDTVKVTAPVEQVYEFWTDYRNFPSFVPNIIEVRDVGNGISHWVGSGPAGAHVEWDSVITEQTPNKKLAWASVEGAEIKMAGALYFGPNDDGTTLVQIRLSTPSTEQAGHAVQTPLGSDPRAQLNEDLLRMKSRLEQANPAYGSVQNQDQIQIHTTGQT
jgi:RNA polymerase sigma factor (sigma-70 family)